MRSVPRRLVSAFVAAALLAPWPAAARTDDAAAKPASDAESTAVLENVIRWSTASEVENFGFDVYRADAEEGPFVRLTDEPIPGAGTTDEPQSYSYADRTIEPERAYYYYVESIALDGEREKFTPVIRAKPKPRPR